MPLPYLFLDMNAYFASVEQEDRPELRGRPVAVVPTDAETTCCIAASYEAKRFGIQTGTGVREARRLCPGLCVVEARPRLYVQTHRAIVAAVETCIAVVSVRSIDEMVCRLDPADQPEAVAVPLARRLKAVIAERVGGQLRCSIGFGPNILLAKLASDEEKPDGLRVIRAEDLPGRLYGHRITDFCGIGPRMGRRFERAGIADVRQLCALSRSQMAAVWGGRVLGDRWWRTLRGEDVPDAPTRRHSLGHSKVLAPDERHEVAARAVTVALLHKAAARLRANGYRAGALTLTVSPRGAAAWHLEKRFAPCSDTLTLVHVLATMWRQRPPATPFKVGIVLARLETEANLAPPLFAEDRARDALAAVMDAIDHRFGQSTIYFGGMHRGRPERPRLPTRIAFTRIPEV